MKTPTSPTAGRRDDDFSACADRHRRILLGIAHGFAQGADRDDLLQEMLLALWHALPGFAGEAALSTFIYRVALNTALGWKRSLRAGTVGLDAIAEPQDPAAGPPTVLALEQRDHALQQALRRLSPLDRSLLLLQLDGLPYRDIADVLGLSESNVGSRLTRARQRLATLIEGDHHAD